jgi:hypothetical protein
MSLRLNIHRHAELVSASIVPATLSELVEKWTLEAKLCLHKQVQGDEPEIEETI